MLPDRTQEAERGQRSREKRGGGAAHLLQRLVQVVLDLRGVLGGEPALAEREQLEPGGGERLSGAVVELAGDASPLLVLERDPALGEQGGDALLGPGDGADREEEERGRRGRAASSRQPANSRSDSCQSGASGAPAQTVATGTPSTSTGTRAQATGEAAGPPSGTGWFSRSRTTSGVTSSPSSWSRPASLAAS